MWLAFQRFAAGVANHAGSTANKGNGGMAIALQSHQSHNRQQRAYMQAGGSGIEADIGGHLSRSQRLLKALGRLVEHTSPLKFIICIHVSTSSLSWLKFVCHCAGTL